jgi:putative aminopeptidase FrvX
MAAEELYGALAELIQAPGVSGSEGPVAQVVAAQLAAAGYPAGALQSDALGNRWLCLGPGWDGETEAAPAAGGFKPQRLLAAHLDEIGLRVTSILPSGLCRVQAVGGIDPQLWEGTPVVVQGANGPLPACIAPVSLHVTMRSNQGPTGRIRAEELWLDLGVSSRDELAELGVDILTPVTWPKGLSRVGSGSIVQGRSLDDRFGCAALTQLAARLLHSAPAQATVLAWTVQEEIGLRGARALAARFPHVPEVIAVDSFTIGMGPRDSRQFDSVTLGGGPALRAWDATTLMPDSVRERVLGRALELGYPLQYGHMPGGNDASAWEGSAYGFSDAAAVFGLGIPVQYSHSNVERAHLGDLEALVELLAAWCA